jgi:prevent-host-death family protein
MAQIHVGIRELKSKLGEYLRLVKSGETITVTEHGKAIGQIVPIEATVEGRLHAMVASGLVEWNGQKLQPYRPKAIDRSDQQLSDLIVRDRA